MSRTDQPARTPKPATGDRSSKPEFVFKGYTPRPQSETKPVRPANPPSNPPNMGTAGKK